MECRTSINWLECIAVSLFDDAKLLREARWREHPLFANAKENLHASARYSEPVRYREKAGTYRFPRTIIVENTVQDGALSYHKPVSQFDLNWYQYVVVDWLD